jgi:hypothetical protein
MAAPTIVAGSGTVFTGHWHGGGTITGGGVTGGTITGGTTGGVKGGGTTGGITTPPGGGGTMGGKKALAFCMFAKKGITVSVTVGRIIFHRFLRRLAITHSSATGNQAGSTGSFGKEG